MKNDKLLKTIFTGTFCLLGILNFNTTYAQEGFVEKKSVIFLDEQDRSDSYVIAFGELYDTITNLSNENGKQCVVWFQKLPERIIFI